MSMKKTDLEKNKMLKAANLIKASGISDRFGTLIDQITFGGQFNGISQGRLPDGSTNIVFMTNFTPRAANTLQGPQLSQVSAQPGGVVSFTFNITPGRLYRVEYKEYLDAPAWTHFSENQRATASAITVSDTVVPGTQRFYRIVLVN